jgi:hypothetical protein
MTTAQEPLAGPSVPSFFKSVLHDLARIVIPSPHESHLFSANVSQQEQLRGVNKAELSSVNNVQRERGAHSARRTPSRRISPEPSPEPSPQPPAELRDAQEDQRCQFTFSDGRQCRHQRAQLCPQHALRTKNDPLATDEDQNINLSPPKEAALQSPELEAICADLTTATNINRALTQVFLLLAQGRISQKQAVAFGYLSQLLLQTIPGIRSEFVSVFGYSAWEANLKPKLTTRPASSSSSGESHLRSRKGCPQDALFAGNTVELSPGDKVNLSEESLQDQKTCPTPANLPPPAARSAPPPERPIRANIPGVPFDRAAKAQIPAPLPAHKRAAPPPAPSATAMTAALTPESSAFRPESPQIQMPSAGSPPHAVASARPAGQRLAAPAAIQDDTARLSMPLTLPSPAVAPHATAPAAKKPRMLWVERLQQFVPESSLL